MALKTGGKKIVAGQKYGKFISVYTERKRRHVASQHCKRFIMGIEDKKADLGEFPSLLGTQGKWYSFGIPFFPAGNGSCLVLEPRGHTDTGFGPVLISGISL